MNEPMNMATKILMVQEVGTEEEITSCINEKGQWHEPYCDRVLLKHGFEPIELGLTKQEWINRICDHVWVEHLWKSRDGGAWVVRRCADDYPLHIYWWQDRDHSKPRNEAIDALLDEAMEAAQEEEEKLKAHPFDPSDGIDYKTASEEFNIEEAS